MPTIQRACEMAGIALRDVDAIAVTDGPGLAGALLVGVAAAKALAVGLGKPLYGVNHLAAHVAVDQLEHGPLPEPCVALLVSGGHSSLLRVATYRPRRRGHPAGRDHRRRGRGGVRQGRPAARAAVPRRPAHRPGGPVRVRGVDRLPPRADLAPRPGAAPLRLLLLRPQDRGRPLGGGPRACRRAGPGGRRGRVASRRRSATCSPARRSTPAASDGVDDIADRRRGGRELPAAGAGRGARRRSAASGCGCRGRGCAPTTARWSRPSAPSWWPAAGSPRRSTCPPTPRCR